MKIITWNCNGAFRRKFHLLDKMRADIFVIQECEDPARCAGNPLGNWCQNYLWVGLNKNRGLAVFSKERPLRMLKWDNDGSGLFLPCRVGNDLELLAVWTKTGTSRTTRYIGQFWNYLNLHKTKISSRKPVICGDFNSNKCWDEKRTEGHHSDVVAALEGMGITSFYHSIKREAQGEESEPTLYFQRNPSKPYHIDYAFIPRNLIHAKSRIDIGKPRDWLDHSDHMPLTFSI